MTAKLFLHELKWQFMRSNLDVLHKFSISQLEHATGFWLSRLKRGVRELNPLFQTNLTEAIIEVMNNTADDYESHVDIHLEDGGTSSMKIKRVTGSIQIWEDIEGDALISGGSAFAVPTVVSPDGTQFDKYILKTHMDRVSGTVITGYTSTVDSIRSYVDIFQDYRKRFFPYIRNDDLKKWDGPYINPDGPVFKTKLASEDDYIYYFLSADQAFSSDVASRLTSFSLMFPYIKLEIRPGRHLDFKRGVNTFVSICPRGERSEILKNRIKPENPHDIPAFYAQAIEIRQDVVSLNVQTIEGVRDALDAPVLKLP